MTHTSKALAAGVVIGAMSTAWAHGGQYRLSVQDEGLLLNGQPFKVIGLRLSNALISDATTKQLIDNLDVFKSYGVNTVSVFVMGSRFGDVKGYKPDATLDPTYAKRLGRILEAADSRGMIVLVGCLYWSTSTAKDDLKDWTQKEANQAIANTVAWLSKNDYRNVMVDVDNEGMAHDATKWSHKEMIDAGHKADPTILMVYNSKQQPPDNADVLAHFSPKVKGKPWLESEGTPNNSPGGYWGKYSKQDDYRNYIRIGRYSKAMKDSQLKDTHSAIKNHAGYMLASTWLQCVADEGIGGPFMTPGGLADSDDIDKDVTVLQKDAGVLWWLQAVKENYGPWKPPVIATTAPADTQPADTKPAKQ